MRSALALLVLAAGPAVFVAAPVPEQDSSTFPEPTEGFTIPSAERGRWTIDELLREYGRVTNQRFLIDDDTRLLLRASHASVLRDFPVAPEHVHSIVESILIENDVVLAVKRADEPRLVSVKSLHSSSRHNLRTNALYVPSEKLPDWRDHPAYLIHTVITLDALDVRVLANSVRPMIPDANTHSILPIGNSNSLILTGLAQQVVQMAEMLEKANEREREWLESNSDLDAENEAAANEK